MGDLSVTDTLKAYQLEILVEFQRICKRHGLRYFAIGGTCIGAVRHKGFIPWDDDIDVAMPDRDYERFIEVAEQELPDKYSIFGPYQCVHYTENYIKVQNEKTTMIEAGTKDYPDRYAGIFIDVFPVYGLPDKKYARHLHLMKNELYKKLNIVQRFPLSYANSPAKRFSWMLFSPVKFLFPQNYFILKQERLMKKYAFDSSEFACFCWRKYHFDPDGKYTYKQVFPKSIFAETIEVPFDSETISIPKGYDCYLTKDFGDYMTPPPKEKRVGGHKAIVIDFERSYKEYAKEGLRK